MLENCSDFLAPNYKRFFSSYYLSSNKTKKNRKNFSRKIASSIHNQLLLLGLYTKYRFLWFFFACKFFVFILNVFVLTIYAKLGLGFYNTLFVIAGVKLGLLWVIWNGRYCIWFAVHKSVSLGLLFHLFVIFGK